MQIAQIAKVTLAKLNMSTDPNVPLLADKSRSASNAPLANKSRGRQAPAPRTPCTSHFHEPGKCHGFEVHKGTEWVIAHGDFDLQEKLDPESRRSFAGPMKALSISAGATTVVMLVEVGSGLYLNSLALLSDGMHQLSDVALYLGLLIAVWLSKSDADLATYSFGYHRAQVLGSLVALFIQYFAAGLLMTEAVERLVSHPLEVDGRNVCLVAAFSLATNLTLLHTLPGGHGHSHGGSDGAASEGGAWDVARLHLVGDFVQGCAVVAAGLITWAIPSCTWADPSVAFVYAGVVVVSTWKIFQDLVATLMERTPPELNAQHVYADLSKIKGVIDVHCCHIWALAPGKVAMSAHLHIEDDKHEDVLHAAQITLKHKFGIAHSTLQISEDEDLA